MKNQMTMDWLHAAAIRAIRTMAQTALSMITLGLAITEIEWMHIVSVSIVSGVYSILTSLSTTLPEVTTDGALEIDTSGEKDIYRLQLTSQLSDLADKHYIHLKVKPGVDLSQE